MEILVNLKKQSSKPHSFLKDVYTELMRVNWPKRKELVSYTIVVLSTVSIMALFFAGIDLTISKVIESIIR